MDLILDGEGPLYLQLSRALRDAIATGRLPHGERLPPTRELAGAVRVSRKTVVAAFEVLRAEGLLRGKVGSGTYACTPTASPRAPIACRPVVPQSDFSRRARQVHDPDQLPWRRTPGTRYAFDVGLPLLNGTLATAWAREVSRVAPYIRAAYPAPQGQLPLRKAICSHIVRTRGVRCTPDDVLIVNGTQQAVSLAARVLLNPGDVAAVEEPGYYATRRILQLHGAAVASVPVDAQGLRVELLADRRVKLVCVTPSHQFPTGAVLSAERRAALLDYASQVDGWILEDDYDADFRQDATAVAALQSNDKEGRVVYAGTFSKTLLPALRLGYIIMPPGLRGDFLSAKWADDFATSPLEQLALANLIRSGAYARHLRATSRKLVELRHAFTTALMETCGDQVVVSDCHTGMHVLLHIPGLPANREDGLIRHALKRGVGLYSARPCYEHPPSTATLLMGYAAMSAPDLRNAVREFGRCLRATSGPVEQQSRTSRQPNALTSASL